MDKNAIKKFAVWARSELISRVTQKALQFGITETSYGERCADSVNGMLLSADQKKQRTALIEKIEQYGGDKKAYEQVIEEVAYTWFNRFTALRFMEVNGYLPTHIRVFTNENNGFKPQILAEAIHIDLEGLKQSVVLKLKEENREDELYKYLLITQCNALNSILPVMFQKIADYTELLFPDNLLREGSVIDRMIVEIPEGDWKDAVQIIGWLYQYYNIEPKDKVFADLKKNIKISRENIPAATQLFTPDWIVRYMVENSLGKLWMEGHPNDELKSSWKYYIDDAEQESSVKVKLDEIRKGYAGLMPTDIKCIDPCMGSGHILVYLFDVLMQIYATAGYNSRDSVRCIIENNIYGLDIDERATQLAYFAVMMKACAYDSRFLSRGIQPHIYSIKESNDLDQHAVAFFCNGDRKLTDEIISVLNDMADAKEYGSILQVKPVDFAALYARFDEIKNNPDLLSLLAEEELIPLVRVAEVLSSKFDIVVTNPPYMGSDSMNPKLKDYAQSHYYDSRYDLYAVCVDRLARMATKYLAMITQHTFLYAHCFGNFRRNLIKSVEFVNAVHLGARAFEEISGEVVQTIAFVLSPTQIGMQSTFVPLTQFSSQKEAHFCEVKRRLVSTRDFLNYDNAIFAYSLTDTMKAIYLASQKVGDIFDSKAGVVTGNDEYFLRYWHEVSFDDFETRDGKLHSKYVPYSKGGTFVKWYGNICHALKLKDLYNDALVNRSVRRGDKDVYFKSCIGWSQMGGGNKKNYSLLSDCICGTATPTILCDDENTERYILGFLNTKIPTRYIECFNPLMSTYISDICNLPFVYEESIAQRVISAVSLCMISAQEDWDSFETSWDFKRHPLLQHSVSKVILDEGKLEKPHWLLKNDYGMWEALCEQRFNQVKANEEELNRMFIEVYGLQGELTPEVEDRDITVHIADLQREIKSLISYAVGCMFGRYSLDVEGLAYAGGEWDDSKYITFKPDEDNILPICDEEYFEDDIVGRFVKFIEAVYGTETLEENLKFIANALGGSGSARDVIRNYFNNGFYADHLKIYQKRPIYWLFDSGKKGGFKALIYMHRYKPDTIARMRTDYVHEQQARYRAVIADLKRRLDTATTSESVKLNKQLMKVQAQADELLGYEEKIHHLADQMISIDLDDGVVANYAKFQDVLAKIK